MLSLTSCNAFQQIINKPIHLKRQSSSCIDLIFTDQPNLSVNSEIHTSLHPNCYHQIVQSKFDLNIFYLPPYQRLIWNYKIADVCSIRKALDLVTWEKLFRNKDPIWISEKIKSKVKSKNQLYKVYVKNGRNKVDFF